MVKLSLIAPMAAVLASASGNCAKAASMFEVFQHLCIETKSEPAAVLAMADALGWSKAPARLVRVLTAPSERGEVTRGADGRAVRDLRGVLGVVVARTNWMIPHQEIPADTCSVVAGPSIDVEGVARDAEGFAAVPGRLGLAFQKSAKGYLWRDLNGARQLLPPEQLGSEAHRGDVKMLVVMKLKDSVVLQLFVPARNESDRTRPGGGETP